MKELRVDQINVSLIAGDDGIDRINLKVFEGMDDLMVLTPIQARALATELITAVNRAEVKASLKTSPNLWRRAGSAPARSAESPAIQTEFVPRLVKAR